MAATLCAVDLCNLLQSCCMPWEQIKLLLHHAVGLSAIYQSPADQHDILLPGCLYALAEPGPCVPNPCALVADCSVAADNKTAKCSCWSGYAGDGKTCTSELARLAWPLQTPIASVDSCLVWILTSLHMLACMCAIRASSRMHACMPVASKALRGGKLPELGCRVARMAACVLGHEQGSSSPTKLGQAPLRAAFINWQAIDATHILSYPILSYLYVFLYLAWCICAMQRSVFQAPVGPAADRAQLASFLRAAT